MPSFVVVGASRGLGYEWLRQLSSDPKNTVIGLVRTPAVTEKRLASDSIQNVHIFQADLADNASLVAAAAKTEKLTDSVDYLILNGAYVNRAEHFLTPTEFVGKEDMLTSSMVESLKVNVLGTVFAINAFLPLVRKSSIKKITVISTGMADRDSAEKSDIPFFLTYSSMKAAINLVVARFAAELKKEGIVVLALCPGVVDTFKDKPPGDSLAPWEIERSELVARELKRQSLAFTGRMAPEKSVKMQKKVIDGVTIENTGSFLSHHGNKEWL